MTQEPNYRDPRLAGGRLTVDLGALAANWRQLDAVTGRAQTAAVVKGNGYGLGIEPVCRALAGAGCTIFFVALASEGLRVRATAPEAEIFVLNGVNRDNVAVVAESGMVPVLGSVAELEIWADYWRAHGSRRPCAVHIDTGMNRLGLTLGQARDYFSDRKRRLALTPILVMSHLACADLPDNPMNAAQRERFLAATALFEGVQASLSNSAGLFLGTDYHFDLVRPGIAIYGGQAVENMPNQMSSVAKLEGRIVQIRTVKKGETVGYGASYSADRVTKIAIISVGYADGYPRSASSSGVPLRALETPGGYGSIAGHKVPIAGRVSMDLTAFDVTDIPDQVLESQQWIELFGANVTLDDTARAAGTIGYEMLTGLGERYQRVYLDPGTGGKD